MATFCDIFSCSKHLYLVALLILFLSVYVDSIRTKEKIYIDLNTQNACFRVLNATHQVGCSSKEGGNVGTLHYIESLEDYDWVLEHGTHTPFVVLMNSTEFNRENVNRLVKSNRVNGILVLSILNNESISTIPTEGFSPDKSCPNDNYGLYHNSSDYKNCKKVEWNQGGEGLYFQDYHNFPMFSISNISDFHILVEQCYRKFNEPINGTSRSYPVCAVQLSDRMDAVKDSITCIRRSNHMTNLKPTRYCDAMGDKNIVATTKMVPKIETRENKSVIVVSTRMDSFSMFEYEYESSDATVTGIITLLATVKALKAVLPELRNSSNELMFTFFQGEAFDYIGSSKMVYDMEKKEFPYKLEKDTLSPQLIDLSKISHFIELSQVGHRDEGKLWIHSDPISRNNDNTVKEEIQRMVSYIKPIGDQNSVSLDEADAAQPLPPASVQRFLKKAAIPAIVITDHKKQYVNKYYNSRFDLPEFINASYPEGLNETEKYDYITGQASSLTKVASTLAQFLYKLTTGNNITQQIEQQIQADELEVAHLLYCFLKSPVCELFKQSVSPDDNKNLVKAKKAFPFYVSVAKNTNQITLLTHSILAQYLGTRLVNTTKEDKCKEPDNDKRYNYLWIQGSLKDGSKEREGVCIKSTSLLLKAQSPAFTIDDYDWLSGEYSTWTESTWSVFKVRVFLIPSESQETLVLSIGVVLTLVSMVLLYFLNDRASLLFMEPSNERRYY